MVKKAYKKKLKKKYKPLYKPTTLWDIINENSRNVLISARAKALENKKKLNVY